MITLAGWFYLAFFGLLIPWLAFRSRDKLAAHGSVPRERYFVSVIFQLLVFLVISLVVARVQLIPVWKAPSGRWLPWLVAAGFVALGVALMRPRWRANVMKRDPKVRLFMPATPRERSLWVLLSVAAGVSEEVTYRGVLFGLLWIWTGSPLAAAGIAAVVFGISHVVQGWKTAGIVTVIALAAHGLVWLDGTLYPVIAAHIVYDVIAGLTYGRLGRELGYHDEIRAPGFTPSSSPSL